MSIVTDTDVAFSEIRLPGILAHCTRQVGSPQVRFHCRFRIWLGRRIDGQARSCSTSTKRQTCGEPRCCSRLVGAIRRPPIVWQREVHDCWTWCAWLRQCRVVHRCIGRTKHRGTAWRAPCQLARNLPRLDLPLAVRIDRGRLHMRLCIGSLRGLSPDIRRSSCDRVHSPLDLVMQTGETACGLEHPNNGRAGISGCRRAASPMWGDSDLQRARIARPR